ncbi:MAG: CcmD family protein [Bacteroidia bacterium]|nr:CcmD family protein [Bacteroidia bacterium]
MKKLPVFLLAWLMPLLINAQSDIAMADTMRQEGKIYVVVAVLSVIFIGIILFLVSIERRVARIEKQINR